MGARWTEVSPSAYAHEREALQYLRAGLPDRDPYLEWSNFTITAGDGYFAEVDALVAAPGGPYLIEIKSHPHGRITGDAAGGSGSPVTAASVCPSPQPV